jgi:hypothetical protein
MGGIFRQIKQLDVDTHEEFQSFDVCFLLLGVSGEWEFFEERSEIM